MTTRKTLKPVKATIVVACFDAERSVAGCADACVLQDYANLEIIFVDDGSKDSTQAILSAYPKIKVLTQENRGPAAARNLGWQSASGQVICFTDSDCLPHSGWVSQLVEGFAEPTVGGVGGGYEIANPDSWLARCIHEEIRQRHLRMTREVNYLGSFNVAYRRSVLVEVGGFDEEFRRASAEDNDLAYRVAKQGHKLIFDPGNCVAHCHATQFWRYVRKQFWHGYWRVVLYSKQPDRLGGDHYAGFLDLVQPPLAVLAGLAWALHRTHRVAFHLACVMSCLILAYQIPMTVALLRRTRDIEYVPFAAVMIARALARGLGMVSALSGIPLKRTARMIRSHLRSPAGRDAGP